MNKTTKFLSITTAVSALLFSCSPKNKADGDLNLKGYDISNMDTTVSPCDDFYQYAIGGWQEKNPIPGTESRWSVFNILSKSNEDKIKVILEYNINQKATKGSSEQLTGDMYASAMNTKKIKELGISPITPFLEQVNATQTKEEVLNLLGTYSQKGLVSMFAFYVNIDAKNSGFNAVYLSQGGTTLPDRDYYLKEDAESEKIRKSYIQYIDNLLNLCGVEKEYGSKILTLETQLATISMSRVEQRDPDKTYNKLNWQEFKNQNTYLDWDKFIAEMGVGTLEEIIVSQPTFFTDLGAIIQMVEIDVLKAYFKFKIVNGFAGYLPEEFEKAQFDFFQTTLRGTTEMKPRWEKSVAIVNGNLGEPLGEIFVKKHFSEESKKRVSEMVEELRFAFGERIKNLDWMSSETKKKALEKLESFGYKIGYPENWKDYSMVDIDKDKLIENVINIRKRRAEMMIEKIGKPVDKSEWGMTPQTVNAYYSPTRNEIVFPAGILQPPFFDPQADDALNYGGIGAVIGHEFSHGFDDKGSKYDGKGNLSNWWTESDKTLFKERTNSIVEQFNNFEVLDGVFIKGELTQGENIADLAGLTMAYYALKRAKEKEKPSKTSPDGFTWQQRFFLGWAQVWAQNITEKELRQRIITDPHSPGRYRVVGPLSNMPEFHEAFGCKPGSNMFAEESKRVVIW